MPMRKQIEIESEMEDYNEKHGEANGPKNGEGQEIKFIRYLFAGLEKACSKFYCYFLFYFSYIYIYIFLEGEVFTGTTLIKYLSANEM